MWRLKKIGIPFTEPAYYSKWKGDKDYLKHKEQALREWRKKYWTKEQIISQLRSEINIKQKEWEIENIGGTPCMTRNCKIKSRIS